MKSASLKVTALVAVLLLNAILNLPRFSGQPVKLRG
jgi:hypothetical protein